MQDKIANRVRDIAGLMLGRRIMVPPQMAGRMREFVIAAVSTSAQALNAIEELDELQRTGPGIVDRGRKADHAQPRLGEADHERQPGVAETDDANDGRALLNPIEEGFQMSHESPRSEA